jgi:glycosyltransferase involved in cell wall biosynthesis
MKILFIHQNFPGQYKHMAPALAAQGHQCVALTLRVKKPTTWQGVRILPYGIQRRQGQGIHPWVQDFDTKVIRAEACFAAACKLRDQGFTPDIILAHPGWGESMFLRDVWPSARIGLYCELYHLSGPEHTGFDPEFQPKKGEAEALRIRLKNLNNMVHLPVADKGLSPTQFQAGTFPEEWRQKISVIHDGIDTDLLVRNDAARFELPDGSVVTRNDEVITFVNRNLEPYRGYHVFMRALPRLLKERPQAKVLIVGGDEVSYGARAPKGKTWKQIFIDEVRGRIPTPLWENVHFLGRIPYDQFISLLQVSRVHVYLTYPFVLSWSLFEAMSAQAAIVASSTAPVVEAIEHDVNGRLVDFFDQDALIDQVCDLLDDPEARERLGQAARALMVRDYDLKTVSLPRQMTWIQELHDMEPGKLHD